MTVIKVDESKEPFDIIKIHKALEKVFSQCGEDLTEEILTNLDEYVKKSLDTEADVEIEVDDIHNLVEQFLMLNNFFAASKSYILGRYKKALERAENKMYIKSLSEKLSAIDVSNQNANVDEKSFGGRIGEASRYVVKDFALNYCMSRKSKNNHLNNEIYIHK